MQEIMARAKRAAAVFTQLDQAHTDRIVRAVYEVAFDARVRLAKMAVEESGVGKWEDKVIKNVVSSQLIYEDIRNEKTVGVIHEDPESGIVEIAQPLGPIFAIVPVTNPCATVIFKILIALKTRNPLIVRPHRDAAKCSIETARMCYEAALREDAPEDCIQWVEGMTREETQELMAHPDLALVLATGGPGLVKAAYSSGTPAIGVGPGNVPVLIDKSADIPFAVEQILLSKTFDNGTVCASEQAIVVEEAIAPAVMAEFKAQKAYFLSDEEIERLNPVAFDAKTGNMRADIVGRSAFVLARCANISVPEDTSVLMAPLSHIGNDYPLSCEILAPVLAFYTAPNFDKAVATCIDLNFHGGMGHTVSIYANDEAVIAEYAGLMNAGRVVVNTPSSQGGVGGIYNRLHPSLTLGCGTGGKNITTDNITARHLLNIQRIARRRVNERFDRIDKRLYFDESINAATIDQIYNQNR